MYRHFFVLAVIAISGCDFVDESDSGNTCHGFGAPNVTVIVADSITRETISTANTVLHYDVDLTLTQTLPFHAETNAYFDYLTDDPSSQEFGLVVAEPNYHTYSNVDLGFSVDSSCNADNSWQVYVDLCPLGSACI